MLYTWDEIVQEYKNGNPIRLVHESNDMIRGDWEFRYGEPLSGALHPTVFLTLDTIDSLMKAAPSGLYLLPTYCFPGWAIKTSYNDYKRFVEYIDTSAKSPSRSEIAEAIQILDEIDRILS